MSAYYNENDPKAAAWLRELITAGHLAPGDVDTRSITEIQPHELYGYTQCHFFAGIGGWSLALRLAGWPDNRPVWTGSCPCQPFSAAGKQLGTEDERHLWPAFFGLINTGKPPAIFGEQVASAAVLGGAAKPSKRRPAKSPEPVWLDGVFADLESAQYACGAADLPAACIGAPHIRQRAWWVAYANGGESRDRGIQRGRELRQQPEDGCASWLADVFEPGLERFAGNGDDRNEPGRLGAQATGSASEGGCACGMADTGHEPARRSTGCGEAQGGWPLSDIAGRGAWSDFDIIPCRDGKARRIESGTFPLAHGIPHRVGLLRGYGNAIVAELAALFIQASEKARSVA